MNEKWGIGLVITAIAVVSIGGAVATRFSTPLSPPAHIQPVYEKKSREPDDQKQTGKDQSGYKITSTEKISLSLTCEDEEDDRVEKGTPHKGRKNCVLNAAADGLWDNIKATDVGLLSVIVAGLMFLLGIGQIVLLRRQADIMNRQAETLPKIERAYLFAKVRLNEALYASHERTAVFRQPVVFKNYGKTPAVLRRVRGASKVAETPPQNLTEFPGSDDTIPTGKVIKPGGGYAITVDIRLTNNELADIQRGGTKLFIFGLVEYEDITGEIRCTGYCWEYHWRHLNQWFEIAPGTPLNHRN